MNSFQVAMERSRTSGCSSLLNQPMKRVSQATWNAIGEQEVEFFLLAEMMDVWT